MPNLHISGRLILGGTLERARCHLCLIWNVFLVRAAKPGSYWRALMSPSQRPSKPPSLSTTLPALEWAFIMHVQMCLVPWEGVSCKSCHRRTLASPWASSTAFLLVHDPPERTELTWWGSQCPALWINWGISCQYWYVFYDCKKSQVEEAFKKKKNWKSSRLRMTEGLRHPKHRSLGDFIGW